MATIAEKIAVEISDISDTKIISISQPTQKEHQDVYFISKLGYKIAEMLPHLSFRSFYRDHLVFFNNREEFLIDISIIFDSIFEILEITCDIRN